MNNIPRNIETNEETIEIETLLKEFIEIDEIIYDIENPKSKDQLTKQYHDLINDLLTLLNKSTYSDFDSLNDGIIGDIIEPLLDDIESIEIDNDNTEALSKIKLKLNSLMEETDYTRNSEGTEVTEQLNDNKDYINKLLNVRGDGGDGYDDGYDEN